MLLGCPAKREVEIREDERCAECNRPTNSFRNVRVGHLQSLGLWQRGALLPHHYNLQLALEASILRRSSIQIWKMPWMRSCFTCITCMNCFICCRVLFSCSVLTRLVHVDAVACHVLPDLELKPYMGCLIRWATHGGPHRTSAWTSRPPGELSWKTYRVWWGCPALRGPVAGMMQTCWR